MIITAPNVVLKALVLYLTYMSVNAKGIGINSFAGPFIVLLKEIKDCPPGMSGQNQLLTKGLISHKKISSNRASEPVFNGIFYLLRPIDDTLPVRMSMLSWNPVSGWKPNGFNTTITQPCSKLFQRAKPIIGSVLKYCPDKPPLTCPLHKKNYTIQDMPTAFRLKAIPAFHYGKWTIYSQVYRKNEVVLCVMVTTETLPPEAVSGQTVQEF